MVCPSTQGCYVVLFVVGAYCVRPLRLYVCYWRISVCPLIANSRCYSGSLQSFCLLLPFANSWWVRLFTTRKRRRKDTLQTGRQPVRLPQLLLRSTIIARFKGLKLNQKLSLVIFGLALAPIALLAAVLFGNMREMVIKDKTNAGIAETTSTGFGVKTTGRY